MPHQVSGKAFCNTGAGALCDGIQFRVITVFCSPAVQGFSNNLICIVIFKGHGGSVIFRLHQTALCVVTKGGGTQRAVAVALRDFLVRHLVTHVVAAVEVRPVRESGTNAAAGSIIIVG